MVAHIILVTLGSSGAGSAQSYDSKAEALRAIRAEVESWERPGNMLEAAVGPGPAGTAAYVRSFGADSLLAGIRLSFGWEENANTVETNVWNVTALDFFVRSIPKQEVHLDGGLTFLIFSPEDDTEEIGTLYGLYGAAWFGYRPVFAGIEGRGGLVRVLGSSEFGLVMSPRAKIVISW